MFFFLRVLELELLTCHIIGLLVALGIHLINNHEMVNGVSISINKSKLNTT